MDDGDDSHDEEYYIEQAKKLSLADGGQNDTPDATGAAGNQPAAEEPQIDVKDVIETDFMKGLVADLELDIGDAGIGDIVNEENKKAEEEKKEEEKKDGGNNGGAAGNQ